MERFPKTPDNRSEEEKRKEEERLGVAFEAVSKGDTNFAKELGINFVEGSEEERVEELFNESLDQQDSNSSEIEQKEVLQRNRLNLELYYQLLTDRYPDLGIKVDDLIDKSGNKVDDFYTLSIKIDNKNRNVLEQLRDDRALELLRKDDFNEEDLSEIIDNKLFPEEVGVRLLVRNYSRDPIKYESALDNIDKDPLSDDELKDIISEQVEKVLAQK